MPFNISGERMFGHSSLEIRKRDASVNMWMLSSASLLARHKEISRLRLPLRSKWQNYETGDRRDRREWIDLPAALA